MPVGYLVPGRVAKICWLPNDQLQYGVWGQAQSASVSGLNNPGPNVAYTNPLGATQTPDNPTTQIIDTNGNLQILTRYGTCGSSQPSWPVANSAACTGTTDGDVTL